MPRSVSLAARVVEVIADLGESAAERYRYGSGALVGGRTVLTAAHVVEGAASVVVRDTAKRKYAANLDPRFVGDPDGAGPDLALIELEDETVDLPPIGLARIDRDSPTADPVERSHAIGYPWFGESPLPMAVRDTVDAIGVIPVASRLAAGGLSVLVSVSPRPLPPEDESLGRSEWSGMSGAPVVSAGRLLGVVIEHAPREGQSAITAVPLTALERDPAHEEWGPGVPDPAAWWSRLGVTSVHDLKRLPERPERPRPPYLAQLRSFGETLHRRMPQLMGRKQELAEIASFATGPDGYRWLAGGAYAGKTALLFEAVMTGLPAEVDAEVDVVSYFLSRRQSDADSSSFLTAVVPQLAYLCGVDPPLPDRYQFLDLWERAVSRAEEENRHLLLVVDGLDEDLRPTGLASVASLLPTQVGARAHVLVASRPYPELPLDVSPAHPLRATSPVKLDPFERATELAALARAELDQLTSGDEFELAVNVLGMLAAASGPLAVDDLVELSNGGAGSSPARVATVRRFVTERAGRSLEPVGSQHDLRYQFAHYSLLEYARENEYLAAPEFSRRLHEWAEAWRERDWPSATPRYLLDTYPAAITEEPDRLSALVGDPGWVDVAIQSLGVDGTLAHLARAAAAAPTDATVGTVHAVVRGQAHHLSRSHPLTHPGYVSRQLWLQAAELGEDRIAELLRERLHAQADSGLVPVWTTRRISRAFVRELGRHKGWVWGIAEGADRRVVTGGDDGRVLLWDPADAGAEPRELGRHDGRVGALAALPDGRVVSGGADGPVRLWDLAEAEQPHELGWFEGDVNALTVLADGRVVIGSADGRVLLWDPAEAGAEPRELGRHKGGLRALAPLADGRVVSGGFDGRVLLWDPAEPGQSRKLGRCEGGVNALARLADGQVVSGGEDGMVLLWDPAEPRQPRELGRHEGWVWAVAPLADGRVVSGGLDLRVLLWDPAKPGQPRELGRHEVWVSVIAALADGRVVSGDSDGRTLLWDPAETGVQAGDLGSHEGWVYAFTALADGRVVSGGFDGRLLLWDPAEAGAQPGELGRHDGGMVRALAPLPDGRVVSGDSDGRVLLWDRAEAGAQPGELGRHEGRVNALAVLADGRVVTGGADERILLWDPAEAAGLPREVSRSEGVVNALAALAEEQLVSGGFDGRVLLWDLAEAGAEPRTLGVHEGSVSTLAALADGRVVSGGDDGRMVLWDQVAAHGHKLGRHDGRVMAVAALRDGRVVSGGADDRVLLWGTTGSVTVLRSSVIALAAAGAGRNGTGLAIAHAGGGLSFWSVTGGAG